MSNLLIPLSDQECKANLCRELGPAQVTLTPYCVNEEERIARTMVIKCSMQRDDLELMIGLSYIEIKNQCSQTPKKVEGAKKMDLKVSLGCAANNPFILAALLGTNIEDHPTDDGRMIVPISNNPGADPTYWQVLVEPLVNGKPAREWGVVMLYAYSTTEDASLIFSPETPQSISFNMTGYMHPTAGSLGWIEYDKAIWGDTNTLSPSATESPESIWTPVAA